MVEQTNSGGSWVMLGAGILMGGLFTYIMIKSRETPSPSPQTPALQTSTMHSIDDDMFRQLVGEIQTLTVLLRSLKEENIALKHQLTAVIEAKPIPLPQPIPLTMAAEAPKIQTLTSTYKNNEKRVYERGKDGFIKSINILRDAQVNAAE